MFVAQIFFNQLAFGFGQVLWWHSFDCNGRSVLSTGEYGFMPTIS
jgi:hypothetical protein